MQQISLTEPILTYKGMPEPPEALSPEQWRTMLVEVGLFGSPTVSEAMEAFRDKVSGFGGHVSTYRILREQNAIGQQMAESREGMTQTRDEANAAYERLRTLIQDELANL